MSGLTRRGLLKGFLGATAASTVSSRIVSAREEENNNMSIPVPSQITNCHIDGSGDLELKIEGNKMIIEKMDRYAMIPLEELEKMTNKRFGISKKG